MSVESAADRAALFSTDEFAVAALYGAPGVEAGVPCRIVYDPGRPEYREVPIGSAGGMRAAIAQQAAMILTDDVPLVEAEGRLVPGAIIDAVFVPGLDSFKIVTRPRLDETGAIWSVDLQKL